MVPDLLRALRDRLRPKQLLGAIALLALFRVFLDASLEQLATTVAMLAIGGITDATAEVYDLRQSVKNASVGGIAVVGATAMLAFGGGPSLLPLVFLVAGGWFVLDAVQTIRHEGATKPSRDGWAVYRTYVGRRVHETLDERPRTRRELSEVLDADDETIDAAIAELRSREVVVRDGSELRLSPREPTGQLARARDAATTVAERIARPLRLEFGDEAGAAEGRAPDRSGRGAGPSGHRRSEHAAGGTDGEREYEPAKER